MKKIVVALVLLVLLASGAAYLFGKKPSVMDQAPIASVVPTLQLPGVEVVRNADRSTVTAFYLSGGEMRKAYETAFRYIGTLRETAVWKTLGLESQLSMFQAQVTSSNPELDAAAGALAEAVREGANAISGTISYRDAKVTLALITNFKDSVRKEAALSALFRVITLSDPKFQSSGDRGSVLLRGNPEAPLVSVDGSSSDTVTTTASLGGVNLTPPMANSFDPSAEEKLLQQARVDDAAGYFVSDNDLFMQLVPLIGDRLALTFPEVSSGLPAATSAARSSREKWKTIASTLSLTPSLRAKSCGVEVQPATAAASGSTERIRSLSLVGPRTPFMFSASTSAVLGYLQAAIDATQAGDATGQADFEALKAGFNALGLREISVVTSLPANAMSPLYGFVFPTEKPVTISDFAAQLSKGLEALKKRYPSAQLPTLAQSSPSGVALDMSNGTVLEGRAIGESLVVFTSTPAFFEEVANALKREKPYITDDRLERAKLRELADSSSTLAYLSTSSLMPLAKQFAPFLSLLNPEARLTDKDYNELLSLLEFNVMYAESILPRVGEVTCSVMGIGLLDAAS